MIRSLASPFSGPQTTSTNLPSEELEQFHASPGLRLAERRLRETVRMLPSDAPESTDFSMEEQQRPRSFSPFQHVGGMTVIASVMASCGPLTTEAAHGVLLLQNVQLIPDRPLRRTPSQTLEKSPAVVALRDLIGREDALAILRKPLGVLSISNVMPLPSVASRRRVIFGGEPAPLLSASNLADAPVALAVVALRQAQEEIFEYGSESQLARTLSALIVAGGADGVHAIEDALVSSIATDETACETLRHLGALNHPQTRTARFRVLAHHLRSESPRRRYAAAVGLADMNTPEALALLEAAIEQEPTEELKRRFRRFAALLHP